MPDDEGGDELDPTARAFGFEELDEELGGGLPQGKLSVLSAPPESQSELLLERIATAHDALYVTTERPAAEVTRQLAGADDPEPTGVAHATPEKLLHEDTIGPGDLPQGGVTVVDPVDGLEAADRGTYVEFLNDLSAAASADDSAVLLHCRRGDGAPALRPTTLGRADLVLEVRTVFHTRKIESYLTVPKHRGGAARVEPIKVVLTDDVDIDTSRDIA